MNSNNGLTASESRRAASRSWPHRGRRPARVGVAEHGRRTTMMMRRAVVDALEQRRMLTLLGLPEFGYPRIDAFGGDLVYTYNAGTSVGSFDVSATPFNLFTSAAGPSHAILGNATFEIHIKTDASGNVIGGIVGADFAITGAVDTNDNFIEDDGPSTTLISGEIENFGYLHTGTTTDQ